MSETPQQAARRLAHVMVTNGFQPEALHPYTNEMGVALFWRLRLKHPGTGEKWIRPMMRSGDSYVMKEPPFPAGKPLYRLHELARRQDEAVLLVEGERCADVLAQLSLLATTSGSADSVEKTDWKPLASRRVTIWPDHDEAGARYATEAAAKLTALGCEVRIIDVKALALPAKGDCVDWLAQHPQATAEEVRQLPSAPSDRATTATVVSTTAPPERSREAETTTAPPERSRDAEATSTPPPAQPPGTESSTEVFARLVSLKAFDYAQVRRAEAKKLGVSVKVLDDEVDRLRKGSQPKAGGIQIFKSVVPAAEPVDPAQLLSDIRKAIQMFLILEPETAVAATLWVAFTWFIDRVQTAPIALITSPEKRCGKSLFLDIIGEMSLRPLPASNVTAEVVYRVVETYKPTLLIDEVDTFFKKNEQLRGIINSGHSKRAPFALRNKPGGKGEDHEPHAYATWGAKALAGIGKLPDTVMDRSVILNMRRKLPGEEVTRFREGPPGLFTEIASRLARFALDAAETIEQARPPLPRELNDRAQDNWEPLLAIADHAGGEWPELARKAALKLCNSDSTTSLGVELLTDVKEVFETSGADRFSSAELLQKLTSDPEKRWATFRDGQPMTPRQFAKRVEEFGVKPRAIRFGETFARGYQRSDFEDAFKRYLSSETSSEKSVTTSHDDGKAVKQSQFGVTDATAFSDHTGVVTGHTLPVRHVTDRVTDNVECFQGCDAVTDSGGEFVEIDL